MIELTDDKNKSFMHSRFIAISKFILIKISFGGRNNEQRFKDAAVNRYESNYNVPIERDTVF